jgi:hypothetical protein
MTKQTTLIDEDFINAAPLKSFFVSMLTRDIALEDAILDLLDNCIDGILRSNPDLEKNKPYQGYKAEIRIEKDLFSITDNCGGIPWDRHDYAFRMGRLSTHSESLGSVGYYGIGMKRAIFKMGRNCLIKTKNRKHQYEIAITPEWLDDENSDNAWKFPVKECNWSGADGTIIEIHNLYDGISKRFDEKSGTFRADLEKIISTQYATILEKGFEVKINKVVVKPKTTKIIFDERSIEGKKIEPYVYTAESDDGVKIFLTVGFTRPIPTQNEIDDEKESAKYSSLDAGWTVICNDRVVVYCNRDELTGWGEASVPRYHTQFIAISGIVEFWSQDPQYLPTTTTKRGLDASSPIYLQVKNRMREGMKIFTNYTNKWKGYEQKSKEQITSGEPLTFNEIKKKSKSLRLNPTPRSILKGKVYSPELPMPVVPEPTTKRITFTKGTREVKKVASYFNNPNMEPNDVGERCFDIIYEEAKKR